MTLGIHVCTNMDYYIYKELKAKQKIIYTNAVQDFFVKKKIYKIVSIRIVESTKNIYHVTGQNSCSLQ